MSSIKKNYLYNLAYQMLNFASAFLLTPYLSRTLGATSSGIYSYTFSTANFFWLFAMLGVQNYGNRAIAKSKASGDKRQISNCFWNIYFQQLLVAFVIVVLYMGYFCFFPVDDRLIVMIQMFYVLSGLTDINWFFFGMEQFKVTVTRNSIIKLSNLLLVVLFVKTSDDLWKYTAIMALGTLLSTLVLWPYVGRYVVFCKPAPKEMWRHFKSSLVLFVPVIAISIYHVMDKIMIGRILHDKTEVGYYDYAEKVMEIPKAFINSLGTVMLPKMSTLVQQGDKEKCNSYIETSMHVILILSFGISFGLAGIAQNFAPLFFGKKYIPCAVLIMWLAPIGVIKSWSNVIRTQYLIPNDYDKIYVMSVIWGAVVNVIANLLLIPAVGTLGAVFGTLLAEFAVMLYQTLKVRKELDIRKYIKDNYAFGIFGLVMFGIVYYIGTLYHTSVVVMGIQIITGMIIYIVLSVVYMRIKKDEILDQISHKIKRRLKP